MKMNNSILTEVLNNLIQKHTDLGEMGSLFWSLGQTEEGDKCFAEAEQVWIEFNRLYYNVG